MGHLSRTLLIALAITTSQGGWAQSNPFAVDEKMITDVRPEEVIFWSTSGGTISPDGSVTVGLRLRTERDFTIYTDKLEFKGPSGYEMTGLKAPETRRQYDPISDKEVDVYYAGEFEVTFQGAIPWDQPQFPVSIKYVGCTQVICLFPHTQELQVPVYADENATIAATTSSQGTTQAPGEPSGGEDLQSSWAGQLASGEISFGLLLALVFFGGIISNLTPCVYPMIPITLRVLANQGKSPYLSASIYASGIVITYTALGVGAALSGGMFGSMLQSTTFNVAFAVIMILLGVTMLGFGNLSKLQMIGNKLGAGKPSLKNTFLMGTGAGLVAAPCTGPILAALLAYTAKSQNVVASTALLFLYSLGFGLPYVVLGGAAAKVSKARVPHQVQVGVKLLFAAVMFGLGLYYLRIPFYSTFRELTPFWPTLAMAGLLGGVVLTGLWIMSSGLQNNKLSTLIPTAVMAVGLFGLSQWVTGSPSGDASGIKLTWYKVETEAFAAARAEGKPILVDMWAEWCEACKQMDATTFQDPAVRQELADNWITLKLDLTEDNDVTEDIQTRYELQSLPTLVLVPPSGNLEERTSINGYVSAATLLNRIKGFKSAE